MCPNPPIKRITQTFYRGFRQLPSLRINAKKYVLYIPAIIIMGDPEICRYSVQTDTTMLSSSWEPLKIVLQQYDMKQNCQAASFLK